MTRSLDPEPSPQIRGGLFRVGAHVAVVRSGSAIVILDLERGTFYAATPEAADAWATLVEGQTPAEPGPRAGLRDPATDEPGADRAAADQAAADRRAALARIAGYLLERRLIEPSSD